MKTLFHVVRRQLVIILALSTLKYLMPMLWHIKKGHFLNMYCNVEILWNKSSIWAQDGILKNTFFPWSVYSEWLHVWGVFCYRHVGANGEQCRSGCRSGSQRLWGGENLPLMNWAAGDWKIYILVCRWRSISTTWVWNTGWVELFGRMSKVLTKYFRFGCYHEKDPAACHLLGDYWEGIKKDFIKVFYSNWFSIGLLYPGLTDLHHQLWRVQTRTQLPQGNQAPSQKPPDEMALLGR